MYYFANKLNYIWERGWIIHEINYIEKADCEANDIVVVADVGLVK